MRGLFRRALPVTVSVAGGIYTRRGIIRKMKQTRAQESGAPYGIWGRDALPLYLYTGDAAELLLGPDACLTAGADTYRVLNAEAVDGMNGMLCVRAVLERQVAP